jgi:hypothetical protein
LPALYPENVDFYDLWQETMFLGQDFLTWLWLSSEIDTRFPGPEGVEIEVRFERKLILERGFGQDRGQVACQTPDRDWTEAFSALGVEKKVVKARLALLTMEFECALTLSADTLAPQSLKLAVGRDLPGEAGRASQIGRFLGQVTLMSSVNAIVDYLYRHFLEIRLSDDWSAKELPRLRKFLEPRLGKDGH